MCAARGHPPGGAAAVPADPDDDAGRAVRRAAADVRVGLGRRAPPTAGPRHGGRPAGQSGADAVHDAGRSISFFDRLAHAGGTARRAARSCRRRRPPREGRDEISSRPFIRRPVATTLLTVSTRARSARSPSRTAAGVAAAAGGFPDDLGRRIAAGRQSGDDGGERGHAARAGARQHCWRQRDRSRTAAGLDAASSCSSISARTSTPRPARCRRRSMPSRGQLLPSVPAMPSYRKMNPSAGADHGPGAELDESARTSELYDFAVDDARAENFAGHRRRRRDGGRQLAAGRARAAEPERARASTASRSTRCGARSSAPTRCGRGASIEDGAAPLAGADQRPVAPARPTTARSSFATGTARRCGSATSRRSSDSRRGPVQHRLLQQRAGRAAR